jgi:hypothetical protein
MNAVPTVNTSNTSTALTITRGGELNTQGVWVNESQARALNITSSQGPLAINGGTVKLRAVGTLDLMAGSLIEVGGGGQKDSRGDLLPGKAGAITLTSDDVIPTRLTLAGDLRALALFEGGQLNLNGGGFVIQDKGVAPDQLTLLRPGLFSEQGFADIRITANRDGITVAPGTQLDLRQQNRLQGRSLASELTGTDIDTITTAGYLEDAERLPTALSLAFKRRASLPPDASAELSIEQGAKLSADPQSSIKLSSDTRLFVDGTLSVPGGNISLELVNPHPSNDFGFDATQTVTLGKHGALLAPAVARFTPDPLGLRQGDVVDGGRVSLSAQRGYVFTQGGSRIDVSGTSAIFDLFAPGQAANRIPTTVRASGGDIVMRAAEGMGLNGVLRGRQGGRLSLTLDPLERETSADLTGLPQFPIAPRSIVIGAAAPTDLARNAAVPDSRNGLLVIPTTEITAGGFGALHLSTRPILTGTDVDSIQFVGAETLNLSQSLVLQCWHRMAGRYASARPMCRSVPATIFSGARPTPVRVRAVCA